MLILIAKNFMHLLIVSAQIRQFALTCNPARLLSLSLYFVSCVLRARFHNHRQGLTVLMASAVVVLKHETSTLRQRHNFISINLKFGVGDYVREVTSPDKVGSGPMSGRDAT